MTLYHITSGSYDEYGTLCFVEGPENKAAEIEASFKALAAAKRAFSEEEHLLTQQGSIQIDNQLGKAPERMEKFGALQPKYAAILNIGKSHALFAEAKKHELDFLNARRSREAEVRTFEQKRWQLIDDYVKKNRKLPLPVLELPEGCATVEIETIHIKDM